MIIDIALGIVLAVVILRYWPAIVALGLLAVTVAVLLALVGGVIYFLAAHDALRGKIATISILIVIFLLGTFVSQLIARRTVLKAEEIGVLLTITIFLTATTAFFIWFISKWALDAGEPVLFLFLLPLAGLWAWLWVKLSNLLRTRNAELSAKPSEA